MRFTRRKLLGTVGVGGLTLGGAFSSGAFSQTEVDREFDLQIAADSNALLALTEGSETYDAVGVDTVAGGRDLLQFDFTDSSMGGGVNNQADTAFEQAFKIENNTSNAVWVWIPAGEESSSLRAPRGGLLGSGNRSTEFRVEDTYDDADGFEDASDHIGADSADGTTGEADNEALDLSFPASIPKNPDNLDTNDLDGDGNQLDQDDYGGGNEQSRAFGMTPGGAVQLGSDESVEVGIRFLVAGSNSPFKDQSLVRFRAAREQPETGTVDDWLANYSSVGSGQTR